MSLMVSRLSDPRWILYPVLVRATTVRFRGESPWREGRWDQIVWGDRGTGYDFLRRLLHKRKPLRGARILVAGCGKGPEVPSYFPYRPAEIAGVDLFDYPREWQSLVSRGRAEVPGLNIHFSDSDLSHLDKFGDNYFDVVSSDAVLEHLVEPENVLREMHRVLAPGGYVIASFGPVFFSFGGDHISGHDFSRGFDHILEPSEDYLKWVETLDPTREGVDFETVWLKQGLLNRLVIRDYVDLFRRHFELDFLSVKLQPRAYSWRRRYPKRWETLTREYRLPEEDLLSKGVIALLRKAEVPSG